MHGGLRARAFRSAAPAIWTRPDRCSLAAAGHLSAAIGYYRADEPGLYENQPPDTYAAEHAALLRTAPQPTLYLHGDRDGCIDLALVADAKSHVAQDSRMEVVEGVGHFLPILSDPAP